MDGKTVEKILSDTKLGYDQMALKFSETRKFFWRDLEFLGDYAKAGDNILDFGCGNGRLWELFQDKKINYHGLDISRELIDIARSKYSLNSANFQVITDSRSLPFPDNFFNSVYSIAVFHHFPGKAYREAVAKELFRVTKPGGKIIITVWNLWQPKYRKYVLKNLFRKLTGRSKLDLLDAEIPFKSNQGTIFFRFHHAFQKQELSDLFLRDGFQSRVL